MNRVPIDQLVIAYGNAMFDCGAHDIDSDLEGYEKLLAKSRAAFDELMRAIAESGKGESRG